MVMGSYDVEWAQHISVCCSSGVLCMVITHVILVPPSTFLYAFKLIRMIRCIQVDQDDQLMEAG